MKKAILWVAWGMIILGGIISVYFIVRTYLDGYWIYGNNVEYDITGQFGDFFGGVVGTFFALAGTLLVVLTFKEQAKQNRRESFETKFYEMINLHKQNVDEIQVDDTKGREAVEKLFYYFRDIYRKVENAVNAIENIIPPSHDKSEIERFDKMKRFLADSDKKLTFIHDLSYGYFFYGINNYYVTKDKQDVRFIINVDVTAILIVEKTPKSLLVPRNSLLGHYFRHLYQMIQFIAKTDEFNEEEKYAYAKMVRAQLSDFEQALLYYNSLSVMGKSWITPLGKTDFEKMCMIARFRMIKNMPYYFEYFGKRPGDLFVIEKNAWERVGKKFFEIDLTN
ncbi:MAG: putative phage abortive infection protein [Bacteroides sp.]|nr:putative phage abortive infection protein [Bacteroides sp.]